MKKTIKYGGLVASLTTAAFTLGSVAPVSAATTVNSTNCVITHSATADVDLPATKDDGSKNYETVAANKVAQAQDAGAQARCYNSIAIAKASAINSKMSDAGLTSADVEDITTATNAKNDAQAIVAAYGTTDFSDATLMDKFGRGSLDQNTVWNLSKKYLQSEGIENPTDKQILDDILEDETYYDSDATEKGADIYAAFNKAKAANEIVSLADDYIDAANAAEAKADEAETLMDEAEAAAAVDAAEQADKDTDDAIERAQKAINKLDGATAIAQELQNALDAVSDGEVTDDDKAAVANAATDAEALKAETERDVTNAEEEVDDVKGSGHLTDANIANLDNDAAYIRAQGILNSYGTTNLTDATLMAKLGKGTSGANAWNSAVATLEADDQNFTDEDVLEELRQNTSRYADYDAEDTIKAFERAKAAQVVMKAIEKLEAAKVADEAAANARTAALLIQDAMEKAIAAEKAVEEAREAIEELDDTAFARELTAALDAADNGKNSGSYNGGETTPVSGYTYALINGANQTYTGSALEFRFDAPAADFLALYIDGARVLSGFTVRPGSTVITVSPEVLEKLANGEHTLTAVFAEKDATATFAVAKSDNNSGKGATGEITSATTTKSSVKTPNTGVYTAETTTGASSNGLVAAIAAAFAAITAAGAAIFAKIRG